MSKFLKLLFIGAIVTHASVAQSTPSKQNEQPFSITISPVSREAKAGGEIYVKIRLTNTSHHDIGPGGIFIVQGLDTSFQYGCRDATGKSVTKEVPTVGSVLDTPAIKPGESREQEAPISRACDLSRPGQYEVQLSKSNPGDPVHSIVKSNTIRITVKP